MDILYFLEERLNFYRRFYDGAAAVFEDTKRRIEAGEEPFVDTRNPEDYDEPAFLCEWQEADDCLLVLGHCFLGLIKRCLHNYMRGFVDRHGLEVDNKSRNSWFDRFCTTIEAGTTFSWDLCPVKRDQIEEINLARNDIEHGADNSTARVEQGANHFRQYPTSRFAEDWEIEMFRDPDGALRSPAHLKVTRESLASVIADVRSFCRYLEQQTRRR